MKLDPNCVRSVLLAIEERLKYLSSDDVVYKTDLSASDIQHILSNYDLSQIVYTLLKLEEASFITVDLTVASGGLILDCRVLDMTYQGHTFLSRIQDELRWGKVKSIVNAVSDFSLAAIGAAAEGVTSAAIAHILDTL